MKSRRTNGDGDSGSERLTQGGLPVKNVETANGLRDAVSSLVRKSERLDARIWLDGVYTELEDALALRNWSEDREVYFKIEGTIMPTEKESRQGSRAES